GHKHGRGRIRGCSREPNEYSSSNAIVVTMNVIVVVAMAMFMFVIMVVTMVNLLKMMIINLFSLFHLNCGISSISNSPDHNRGCSLDRPLE
ncbi:10886_t:CDS:2, partial [Gigaspora rosea]